MYHLHDEGYNSASMWQQFEMPSNFQSEIALPRISPFLAKRPFARNGPAGMPP